MKTLITLLILMGLLTTDSFSQWTLQTNTNALYSVSAVDNDIVWGCGPGATVLRTINGGANWISVGASPVTGDLLNIFGVNSTTALVTSTSFTSTTVWKTSNGGTTWIQVFDQPDGIINAIYIKPDGNGFMFGDPTPVGERWSLWRTSNFGTTWDSSGMRLNATGFEFGFQNALFADGNNYYFGTSSTRVYHSSNSGANWVARTTTIPATYSIWFNGSIGIIGGLSIITPGVNRSTNSGASWSAVTVPTTNQVGGVVGDASSFWIARGSAIYKSTDDGSTWAPNFTAGGVINHMCKARTGNRLWAVTSSGNIYLSEGILTNVQTVSNFIPKKFSLSQNYPNPFNPSTKIKFAIPNSSFVKLAVYDILGREVSSLVNQQLQAGTYEYEFSASELNSGVYFYKISSDGFSEIKKMVLIK